MDPRARQIEIRIRYTGGPTRTDSNRPNLTGPWIPDNRVEAMEQKLFELSKKFDTMNQKQSPGGGATNESHPCDHERSRVKELESELKQERARIAELEEQLKDYELEKAENAKQLSKSMDKIYDLEQDIDQGRD